MFSHKDVLPSGRILVFMITLGKTFFYLSVSTFIIASGDPVDVITHDKVLMALSGMFGIMLLSLIYFSA